MDNLVCGICEAQEPTVRLSLYVEEDATVTSRVAAAVCDSCWFVLVRLRHLQGVTVERRRL